MALLAGACQSAECAEGLQVVDGQCVEGPTCGECKIHEFCDTGVTPNVCTCAAGYEGNPCVFTKLIEDPGFEADVNAGPWIGDKGATVLPTLGKRDPGEGALDGDSVVCNAGSLLQVVDMPSYDLAEPFVVEVIYKAEGVHGMGIGFNRSWTRLRPTGPEWVTKTFCLGEGGNGENPNGGKVEVRISASERHTSCGDPEHDSSIRIDHFTIRPAEGIECVGLEPGGVLNGTADASEGGWRFFKEGQAEAGFAPAGRDGTSGARLARDAGETGRATMTTQISVPLPVPVRWPGLVSWPWSKGQAPALVFWWKGASEGLFDVELGTLVDIDEQGRPVFDDRGRQVDTLVGTGNLSYLYCLPPWTHGSVLDLSFSLPDDGSTDAVELVIDDVAITSDLDCGTEEDLLDPGFESAPNHWLGASVSSIFETVLLQPDKERARTDTGLLELSYETADAKLSMETYVFVPQIEGDEGPAVTFFSKSPVTPSSDVQWVLGRSEWEKGDVQTEITWQPNEACLPQHWVGRWFRVQVLVESPEVPFGQERVLLDDFALGTSPSCQLE